MRLFAQQQLTTPSDVKTLSWLSDGSFPHPAQVVVKHRVHERLDIWEAGGIFCAPASQDSTCCWMSRTLIQALHPGFLQVRLNCECSDQMVSRSVVSGCITAVLWGRLKTEKSDISEQTRWRKERSSFNERRARRSHATGDIREAWMQTYHEAVSKKEDEAV